MDFLSQDIACSWSCDFAVESGMMAGQYTWCVDEHLSKASHMQDASIFRVSRRTTPYLWLRLWQRSSRFGDDICCGKRMCLCLVELQTTCVVFYLCACHHSSSCRLACVQTLHAQVQLDCCGDFCVCLKCKLTCRWASRQGLQQRILYSKSVHTSVVSAGRAFVGTL